MGEVETKVWMRPRRACARPRRRGRCRLDRARQPGDGRVLHALGDRGHGLEVALGGDRKSRLDDVDAHPVEAVGDLELLLEGHGRAGALLAVAQRRVEDDDAVGRGGHISWSFMSGPAALERAGR